MPRKQIIRGGVIEFDELNPGNYIIEAKAFDSNEGDLVVGWGTAETAVNAGESTECTLALALTKCISTFDSVPSSSKYKYLAVASSSDMVKLGEWVNSGSDLEGITITLADDVDLSDCTDWQPIGFVSESENKPFRGTFDGRGHSLSFDLSSTLSGIKKIGVFYINNGIIENLMINQYTKDGNTIDFYNAEYYANSGGGICAENYGIVRNCINKSKITVATFGSIGGICMSNAETGIIENCLFSGNITMNSKCNNGGVNQKAAGICPVNKGSIKNCVNNGSIKTESVVDNAYSLNNLAGTIFVCSEEENFIQNCYWLQNCVTSGTAKRNRIAYTTATTYKDFSCISDDTKITGCGYFETNSPTASVTAGTTSECKSAQTLAYSGTLLEMLNAYVAANSDSGLKKWKSGADGNLAFVYE